MKVALVTNLKHDQLGLFYISAVLKRGGHVVKYFFADSSLERQLKKFSPELVGFSALTGNHLWVIKCAEEIKEYIKGVKTIIGGAHATYYPDVIQHKGIDMVCRGEGERVILELLYKLENGENYLETPGFWIKEGEHIYRNPTGRLTEDLDSLPFPDRSIYRLYPFYSFSVLFPFIISSRGCPYSCSFCFEPVMRELVKGKGKYVRFRSPENVIQEVLEMKRDYKIRSVEFVDDIFGMRIEWLRRFAELWSREVKLPYQCNLRADLVTEDIVETLKVSGCTAVALGVESGTEKIRNTLFDKKLSEESIISASKLLHQRGIRVITYNILGVPGESINDAWNTVYINQKIKADYASVSLMQPYPGTKVYALTVNNGTLQAQMDIDRFPFSFHEYVPFERTEKTQFINLQKLFNIAVWFPKSKRVIKTLIRVPVNPLFYAVFIITHVYGFWIRIKRVPITFVLQLLMSVGMVLRRNKLLMNNRS